MNYFLIYAIVAVGFETVFIAFAYKKAIKKLKETEMFRMIKDYIWQMKSMQVFKKKIWNWYTITFVILPLYMIVCTLIFPSTIGSKLKKFIFGKSKLEKEAEKESKDMEESSKAAKEWMKNEGEQMPLFDGPDEPIIRFFTDDQPN